MRALQELTELGYIIKPKEQPRKLTRISFMPLLANYLADKGLTPLDLSTELRVFLETSPICSNPDTEIGFSINPKISWDSLGQESAVMYSKLGIKPLTYYTEGSRDSLGQEKEAVSKEIKITNRQTILLERIYFWGYLFDFTKTRMTDATLEKLLESIPLFDDSYKEDLTVYERNVIYTYIVKRAKQPWNYLLSAIKEEYYKSKFDPEVTDKYIRLKKILFELKGIQASILKNEILKKGYDLIEELLTTFEFGYKVQKGDIDLVQAAEKIALKIKGIESNYTEFKVSHKINTLSRREELELRNRSENNPDV
jgi:hypothetical protein